MKKPLYYIVLYRPKGSKVWTERNPGPFTKIGAEEQIKINKSWKYKTWIETEKCYVSDEYAIGAVYVEEGKP